MTSKLWTHLNTPPISKSIKPLDAVIQQSRLAAVAGPIPSSYRSKFRQKKAHPTHQVITTTPASKLRQNWGLKNTLPKKQHVPYVTLDHYDRNGLTGFESGAGFAMVMRRIKELQKPVSHLMSPRKDGSNTDAFFNSLMDTKKDDSSNLLSLKQFKKEDQEFEVRKTQIVNHLINLGYNKTFIQNITQSKVFIEKLSTENSFKFFEKFAKSQLGKEQLESNQNTSDITLESYLYKRPIATAGVSYALKGSMHNRPAFIYSASPSIDQTSTDTLTTLNNQLPPATNQYPIVPGRVTSDNVTIAGLVATSNLVTQFRQNTRKPDLEAMKPFSVRNIELRNDGSLNMNVEAYTNVSNRQKLQNSKARKGFQSTVKQLANSNMSRSRLQVFNDE